MDKFNFSPDIKIISRSIIKEFIDSYRKNNIYNNLTFLDIGGRNGEYSHYAEGFNYKILEIDKSIKDIRIINGDICSCDIISDNSYDIVFSNSVFEHISEPWKAAEECVRISKINGLNIHLTVFSWRYHPVPEDYYRYSHAGMKKLFERTGQVETLVAGYDLSRRRYDHRGGKIKGNRDIPPIDELGGWREHWITIYIAKKIK